MEFDRFDRDFHRFFSFRPEVEKNDNSDDNYDSGNDEYLFPPGFGILLFFHFPIPDNAISHAFSHIS
jgi:hypothetical protein